MLPRKAKTFDFGICTSYDVSGCSLKEYPKNFNKGMQNLRKSKFNNNAASRSKNVDETTVDETGVVEMVVDKTGVDELGC